MGCDIHFNVESKRYENSGWRYEGRLYDGRNYTLFAQLAGVRNRDAIEPAAKPRGVPEDMSFDVEEDYKRWDQDAHSASYLTLKELKDYRGKQGAVPYSGLISAKEYEAWKKSGAHFPSSWCQGTSGDAVPESEYKDSPRPNVYVECRWEVPFVASSEFWTDTIGLMEAIAKNREIEDDCVRCVFWFDN